MESILVTLESKYTPEIMSKVLQIYTDELERVNSLYVRKIGDDYIVKLNIHKNDKFNGVKLSDTIKSIVDHILLSSANKDNSIVYYVQSGLDVLDRMYEPLMMSLAKDMHSNWGKYIDYEDLFQMCRLTLCKLYKAGYYIHKSALKQAFIHDVIVAMRSHVHDPILVGLYDNITDEGNGTISEELPDTALDNTKQDEDETDTMLSIFNTVKPLIIDAIGERRFKILMLNIENKTVDAADRMLIYNKIRKRLGRNGYNLQWFKKKLGGE